MKHSYSVWIHTGDHPLAGTDSTVAVQLIGTEGKTEIMHFFQDDVFAFERDSVDRITVETDDDIGDITRCCLGHDKSIDGNWFVKSVRVRDNITFDEWQFEINDWVKPEQPTSLWTCADTVKVDQSE